ncbi:hypothetical protein Dsin_031607 [Dipteronia sinensis]|uniref:Gnk2-homologous domain-containing protein n=1 Tax=Dipteronia sinensis TaxID=43782 RepID=A0AAE0DS94_9ROSI|nr:hypothetical protein Dsin_031607 [Dipteronia sinensis]
MECNENNITDPVVFNRQLGNLLRTLSTNAASSTSKFSVGQTNFSDFQNINAMVQCTRNLAGYICSNCLQDNILSIPRRCNGKQGGRVFSLSCNLRFEIYPFFLLSSPSPASLVQPNSTSQDEKKSFKSHVFVAIPVAATMVVALIVCCCFFWRKAKRKRVGRKNSSFRNMINLPSHTYNVPDCDDAQQPYYDCSTTLPTSLFRFTRRFWIEHRIRGLKNISIR